ncbi:uncharacterized protein IWZ02DRAFT_435559 [Phyllosticta citriasiana]|uniref:Ribonucleases P/MRP subunit Pop8-like domain-containing protein n=1 Tax=Phyllosticta citriasiana TaxID=595635 RepID=A0ABR1L268_9PEZI
MPSTLPLSQPPPTTTPTTTKATPPTTTTYSSSSSSTTATKKTHTHPPSPHLYIHLTYHLPHPSPSSSSSSSSDIVTDPITLRQSLTAALRQHHGHHGAAIPLDILYVGASAPNSSASAAKNTTAQSTSTSKMAMSVTHIVVRAPLDDGGAVVSACGAWVGEAVVGGGGGGGGRAGVGMGRGGEDDDAMRSRWVVRGWDGVLARLVMGGGQDLF